MRDDALPMGRILLAALAIAATIAIAAGVALALLAHRHVPPGGLAIDKPASPGDGGPALQSAPQPDLADYRAHKLAALHGLGWVDAASGVAHVPIEAAMALQAASSAGVGDARTAR